MKKAPKTARRRAAPAKAKAAPLKPAPAPKPAKAKKPAPAPKPPPPPPLPPPEAPAPAPPAEPAAPPAAPAPPRRERRSAVTLAKKQREISVSEFFAKNRHLLGFDSPAKALLTAVKEAVDNALDACEEAGILPSLKVEIVEVEPNARYRISVEDNGPGIVKAQVPRVFGKLLYGSKFHRLRQSLTGDQPVVIDRGRGVETVTIGELVDGLLGGEAEIADVTALGLRVPAFDPRTRRYGWHGVSHAIRHERANEVLEVEVEDGARVRVTGCHSLFGLEPIGGRIVPIEARELSAGSLIAAPGPRVRGLPAGRTDLVRLSPRQRREGLRRTKTVRLAGDLRLVEVRSVRRVARPPRHVYDLSVPGCENFLAGEGGWLACHNSRGQQGIGISAAGLYGLLTTGKPVVITSRIGKRAPAHHFELVIDTKRNEPNVIVDTEVPDWAPEHGTRVEIELTGAYKAGRRSVDEYLEQTALANPHAELHYTPPKGRASVHLPRVVETLPAEPEEIKPHPHGVELGVFMRMVNDAGGRTLSNVLTGDFSRVSARLAAEIITASGLAPRRRASGLEPAEIEKLYAALQSAKLVSPSLRSVVAIGEDLVRKGLEREAPNAELYVTRTRPPRVYRGNPFLVEVGLAYGGQMTGRLDHVGAATMEGIWIGGVALELPRRLDQALLAIPGMTRAKAQELCHRAQVDALKKAGALASEEVDRLRAALEADFASDAASRPIELVRLANRVPLQYQQSACAITQAVVDTNWKRYGIAQPRGGLPTGPVVLVVHIASVWVPFTSESKEAIAHYPEIVEEIQRGLQECGRQLGAFLNKRAHAREQAARRDKIGLYAGELVEALHVLTGRPKAKIKAVLDEAQRKHVKVDEDLLEGEKEEEAEGGQGQKQQGPKQGQGQAGGGGAENGAEG